MTRSTPSSPTREVRTQEKTWSSRCTLTSTPSLETSLVATRSSLARECFSLISYPLPCTDFYTVAVVVNRRMERAGISARTPNLESFPNWRLQSTLRLLSSWVGLQLNPPSTCDINKEILQARSTRLLKPSICLMLCATEVSLWSWAPSC